MSVIALNNENTKLLINLLERLPMDIYSEIMEFNPEHRAKMNVVLSQMLRYVYCPSYYHAAEAEIYGQRDLILQNVTQLNSIFTCPDCGKSRQTYDIFSQIYYERYDQFVSDDVYLCAQCHQNQNHNDNDNDYDYHYDNDFISSIAWDGRGIDPWLH